MIGQQIVIGDQKLEGVMCKYIGQTITANLTPKKFKQKGIGMG